MIYDVIIIGMGPGGMSAAIYAKRNGLSVLMLEKYIPGGLINFTFEIENYLGFNKIKGPDLATEFLNHIKALDIPYKIKEVLNIKVSRNVKKVITKDGEYLGKYVIIAPGRSPRTLGLENEKELLGKGISNCALCDGMFFKDKEIAVVGGGNSALEESLHLSNICSKVYLIHRSELLRGDIILQEKIKKQKNIEIIYNSKITKINAENGLLKSIEINNKEGLDVSGLFIYVGFEPKVDFVKRLVKTTDSGYIKVNSRFETSRKGIYAIGDIIPKKYYQIVTAVSDGATAAINISRDMKK